MPQPVNVPPKSRPLTGVKYVVPVASGKGGVGKSTVSVNLALALARGGARVGLMDADVYGPSVPALLGIHDKPRQEGNRVIPVTAHGIKVISMAFFVPENEAAIVRGPILHKLIQQFLGDVEWGELDYLIIDLPPGTGDVQLSLCQSAPLTGAVVVSTPQDVALRVAEKAILMFQKLNCSILGIVENMSYFQCGHCGSREEIFGSGGARKAAERLEIPFLGEIPLATPIRSASDEGRPLVVSQPDSPLSKAFLAVAEKLASEIGLRQGRGDSREMTFTTDDREVRISWKDGHESVYPARFLRLACPCAACVDERTGARRLKDADVRPDVHALHITPVGNYGMAIAWSDGHSTGIYTFDQLKKLAV